MVPQESVLFTGTIESNLLWGSETATKEELHKALEIAQAAEFVDKLAGGLQTPVNQGGKNFSGGQRQRLTIARALVGSPQILILDDSASALDFATDAALRKAIKNGTKNMTVLMVSQRASTIKRADKIIVLDDGEVAGIGTHEELMENCEAYQEICLSQLSRDEVNKK
jgi:ATP-binding cassette subfamily B protein